MTRCNTRIPTYYSKRARVHIYTPNLGLMTAVSVREREQGCFRGGSELARGRSDKSLLLGPKLL